MMKNYLLGLALFLVLAAPLFTSGACIIQGGVEFCDTAGQGVPVPYNLFFIGGPAGSLSASQLIIGVINILLAIVGLLSVLFIIIGGFRYVTAHGDEEQAESAKKTILHALLGLLIVILSFVMVRVIVEALVYNRK